MFILYIFCFSDSDDDEEVSEKENEDHHSAESTIWYVLQAQAGLAFFGLIVYLLIKNRDRFEWYRRRRYLFCLVCREPFTLNT